MAVNKDGKPPTLTMDYLKDYLQRNSSPNKKLSFNEILMGISMEFEHGKYSKNHMVYSVQGVAESTKKQLERLLLEYGNGKHPFLRNSAGIHIFCADSNWDPEKTEKRILPDRNNKVFYAESALNEESVNILRDAIEVFPYAEQSLTDDIISQLNRLTPEYNRITYSPKRLNAPKTSKASYYYNIREIMKALSDIVYDNKEIEVLNTDDKKLSKGEYDKKRAKKIKKLSFEYYSYNEKKELELRPAKDGSKVRTVNPVKLMWANGYYYLVTVIPKKTDSDEKDFVFINYRVDRMKEVKCLDEDAVVPGSFSSDKYRRQHPVMYAGEHEKKIEIRCRKSLINNALDTFGFDIYVTPDEDGYVIIKLNDTTTEGVKMWALEYGFGCEILSPQSLREEMREAAANLMKMYG